MPVRSTPRRLVCLTEETVETLYALGADDLIVGVSGFAVRPARVRKEKPKVSTYLDARFDDILALKPDLVLAWSDLQADICAELIRRGIEVHCFNHRTVDGILDMIVRLGAMVGLADHAGQYATTLRHRVDDAADRGAARRRKPHVYFEEWYDPLITGIAWVSELVEICGGNDVFAENRQYPNAKERILTDPLEPVRRNPDVMIASWCGKMFKPDKVRARAGWELFRPAQTSMMFEIPSPIILQPGPAALTDGIEHLHRIFDTWERGLG
ncbi:MAG: ABC transporter substrate-binding protein [Candidatus Kapabacteria bacterium]|nr:ABC transporter substrate-binding protein [Candidatus Kapabacteria bacterium]